MYCVPGILIVRVGKGVIVPYCARRVLRNILVLLLTVAAAAPLAAQTTSTPALRIDIPVKLAEAKVVMNISHRDFEGDEPTGLFFLHAMTEQFRAAGTKAEVIAIFHGDAGYMLLGDETYDRVRKWQGGNPYKEQIAALQRDGVAMEECGKTMAGNGWVNADMLPGVKINTGANFRIVQLVQQGFVQIQP